MTAPDELDRLLDGERATVLAGGHTHIQMLRQHRGMLLVNPGSVGMPFKEYASGGPPTILAHAEYAVVSADGGRVEVSLRRVELDKAALLSQLDGCDLPLATGLRLAYATA